MSVQLALGVVGGVIGGAFGYPQFGFFLGSLAGAALTPKQKIQGPKLDDLSAPRLQYGQAIPRLYGTHRVSGTPIWCSELQPHESSEDVGKGGGQEVTTTTYTVDILLLCTIDTPAVGITRVWRNKELVYSVGPGADDDSLINSGETPAWNDIALFDGNPSQTPWAIYEAAVGIGNAPAYRHRTTVAIYQLECPNGQVPLIEVELFTAGTPHSTGDRLSFDDGLQSFTGDVAGGLFSGTQSIYGSAIQVLAHVPDSGAFGIFKDEPAVATYGWRCKFYMVAQSDDDAGGIALNESAVSAKFALNPRREVTFDALRRPRAYVNGEELVIHSSALPMFTWHELQVELVPGAGNSIARLYDLDSNTLLSTTNFAGNFTSFLTDEVSFGTEFGLGTGDTVFADVRRLGTPATIEPVDLQDIVEAECLRVGLDSSKLDASDLAGVEVPGYATTQPARATLEELALMYYFEAFCDDKLRIVARGGASTATIPYEETGAGVDQPGEPFNGMDRADELTVPAFYSVVAPDPTRDYEPGSVMSDRLVTQSSETQQVPTSLVLTPSQAKGRADSFARDARATSQSGVANLGIAYLERTPTDVVTLTDSDGTTYRTRILRMALSDFVLRAEVVLDDVNALADEGIAPADGDPSVTVAAPGSTYLELVDGHVLRDDDDDAGLYGATRMTGTSRAGSRILKSADGVTFSKVVDIPEQALGGQAMTALADVANPYVWDEVSTVRVKVNGTLASSTKAAMQADVTINTGALRSGAGWEYLRYRTATLVAANTFDLSGLMRGVRGTEAFIDGHAVGDSFLVLRTAGIRRLPGNIAEIGIERFYKGLTLGAADAPSIPFTNQAAGLKPFSPARLRAARDGSGDITFTWSRRTRLTVRYGGSGGTLAPLGEDSEAYQVDIYDGSDVVRTISSASESAAYSAADQTTDFGGLVAAGDLDAEVFQISAAVGRGYGLRKSV